MIHPPDGCWNCRFFRAPGGGRIERAELQDFGLGQCRRRAPSPTVWGLLTHLDLDPNHAQFGDPEWPNVSTEDWCGEHEKEQR